MSGIGQRSPTSVIRSREKKIAGLLELGLNVDAFAEVLLTTESEVRRVRAVVQGKAKRRVAA